jgi:Amidohydrolase
VKPVDPDDPAVGDIIADWKRTPGAVGIRIMMTKDAKREPYDPGLDRILRAAVRHDFPVNILCWGTVDAGTVLIDRHSDTRFIIDHLAILQPRTPPAPPASEPQRTDEYDGVAVIEAAGFRLVAEASFWRNPDDTHDFPSYKPTMPVDNFVLKFQKPM